MYERKTQVNSLRESFPAQFCLGGFESYFNEKLFFTWLLNTHIDLSSVASSQPYVHDTCSSSKKHDRRTSDHRLVVKQKHHGSTGSIFTSLSALSSCLCQHFPQSQSFIVERKWGKYSFYGFIFTDPVFFSVTQTIPVYSNITLCHCVNLFYLKQHFSSTYPVPVKQSTLLPEAVNRHVLFLH